MMPLGKVETPVTKLSFGPAIDIVDAVGSGANESLDPDAAVIVVTTTETTSNLVTRPIAETNSID